jgi:hypothetical protein
LKLLKTIVLFDHGSVCSTPAWQAIHASLSRSVDAIRFPPGSDGLVLTKKRRGPDKKWLRNGVGYLKKSFFDHLVAVEKWTAEADFTKDLEHSAARVHHYPDMERLVEEPVTNAFGPFDFVTHGTSGVRVAIEWETGNISSSHRSLNKLCIAIRRAKVQAGVLIVPSRDLYDHLTDRIGNFSELTPYLSFWQDVGSLIERGLLAIVVVEHDELRELGDYLPVGNDGRAAEGRKKSVGPAAKKDSRTKPGTKANRVR